MYESIQKREIRTAQHSIDISDQMAASVHGRVQNREEETLTRAGFMGDTKFLSENQAPVVDDSHEFIDGKEITGRQYITFYLFYASVCWVSIYLFLNTEHFISVFRSI